MARFANAPATRRAGPSNIQGVSSRTANRAPGFVPGDPHVELFNLAVSGMLTDNFYETGAAQVKRIQELVPQCEGEWLQGFVPWLRSDVGMRSAAIVVAAEFARHFTPSREVVASAIQRADEPGEMLAYWRSHVGHSIPSCIKRGISDALTRVYNEYSLLKWDGQGRAWRFGDVIEVVHPKPDKPWRSKLYQYALDRRRHSENGIPEELTTIVGANYAERLPTSERRRFLRRGLPPGFTWERLAGWVPGGMDAEAWESVIPQMGVMALVRNLNNFDRAGISKAARDQVIATITDHDAIRQSKMFPFRFLTAYKNIEADTYKLALSDAAEISIDNLPFFGGDVLIMVDCSGSMRQAVGEGRSSNPLRRSELAGFFAESLARRFDQALIVTYGERIGKAFTAQQHVNILRAANRSEYGWNLGGTYTWRATTMAQREANAPLIIIITDEQAHDSDSGGITVPIVTWNVVGYRAHHANHGKTNRWLVSGVNDLAMQMLPAVIKRADGGWPWETN